MTMEKDSIPSENKADQIEECIEASGGGEDDSTVSDDFVAEEYSHLSDLGSSTSVLVSPDISCDGKKHIAECLKMKPIIIKKVKKTKVLKLFGVDIHVSTESEYIIVHNPKPLRCFNPNPAQFVPVQSHDPLDQGEEHVENAEPEPEPQPLDDFSRLLQNIEARFGVRPVLLYQKYLTKSDLSSNLNRLFIPKSLYLMGFLRDEERRRVEVDDKNIWLDVLATDQTGASFELRLKMWPSLDIVVLKGRDWKKVVSKNNLETGHLVELWAYRERDTELRLAMNFKRPVIQEQLELQQCGSSYNGTN